MTRHIHVCLLTSSHPVTYSRFLDRQAAALVRAGYKVTLVGLGEMRSSYERSCINMVAVEERRLAGKLGVLKEIARVAATVRPSFCQCLDPWTLAVGLVSKRRRPDLRLVYDASEWFSRAFLERTDLFWGLRVAGYVAIEAIEHHAMLHADAILDTNETRAARFIRRGRSVTLVPNYPPIELLPPPVLKRDSVVVYTGLMSRHRGYDRLLTAMAEIRQAIPEVRLRVMGNYDPRDNLQSECETFIRDHGLTDAVELKGWLRYHRMLSEITTGLLGVVLLQPHRLNDYTGLPNKLFEFMGCGLAVVVSDFPELRRVVNDTGCGWLVDPTDPESLARVLEEALSDPAECVRRGLAGRAAVWDRYNWGVAERQLLNCYRSLLE